MMRDQHPPQFRFNPDGDNMGSGGGGASTHSEGPPVLPTDSFTFRLEGLDAEHGSIDIELLAPALLELSGLMREAGAMLSDGHGAVQVKVNPDFERGSFVVHLDLVLGWVDAAANLLTHQYSDALSRLIEYIGIAGAGSWGLIKLIKWLRGQPPKSVTPGQTPGILKVEREDGEIIEVPVPVIRLYNAQTVRRRIQNLVEPIRRGSVSRITFHKQGGPAESIERHEASAFRYEGSREADETTFTIVLRLISAAFRPGLQWRFHDGAKEIRAYMRDEDFQAKIDSKKVRFGPDDRFRVRMRHIGTLEDGEERSSLNEVLEVLEHVEAVAPTQTEIPETDNNESDPEG